MSVTGAERCGVSGPPRISTPLTGPVASPSRTGSTAGNEWSASPQQMASIHSNDASICTPISPSQFAPPKTTSGGSGSAFRRRATARLAHVWWKVVVKPTTRGRCAMTRSTHASTYSPASPRAASIRPISSGDAPVTSTRSTKSSGGGSRSSKTSRANTHSPTSMSGAMPLEIAP